MLTKHDVLQTAFNIPVGRKLHTTIPSEASANEWMSSLSPVEMRQGIVVSSAIFEMSSESF